MVCHWEEQMWWFASQRWVHVTSLLYILDLRKVSGFHRFVESYLLNPSARAGCDTRSIFKRSLTGLNSEFSLNSEFPRLVASPRLKNSVCPTILPIAGGRIIGFIPFPRVLVLCEMQSVLSRIWTRVAVSISYYDNHYTTGTFLLYGFFCLFFEGLWLLFSQGRELSSILVLCTIKCL